MEQFIEIVKQFPLLWNTESKDYHNLNKKDVVWNRIVEEISDPDIPDVKTAKNEWKKLRDSHRESLKRMKSGSSGQAASPTNNWKYAQALKFLLPHMKNRKRNNASITNQNSLPGITTERQSILPGTSTECQSILPGTSTKRQSIFPSTSPEHQSILPSTSTQRQSMLPGTTTERHSILPGTSTDRQSILSSTSTDNQNTDLFEENQNDERTSEEPRQKKRKVADDSSIPDLLRDFMQRCKERDKRKAAEAEEAKKDRHPMNLFFDSMCESTKKLPDWIQRDVKKKFLQILCEAEENYETYLSGQSYQCSTPTENE